MTVEPIGWVALFFGLVGLYFPPTFMVCVFLASTLLGAAAAIILPKLGGTTVQPGHLLLGFLFLKLMTSRDIRAGALRSISFGSPGFWLLVTVIYSTITAFLMPRLFMGETMTYAARMQGETYTMPLGPTTSNLTQSVYFVGNFVTFFVLSGFGSSESGQKSLARAALGCVILNLAFVVADLGTYFTNTSELLSFIRNSTYSTLSDTELAGFKRIVGSFVEASSFGYWTLGYFAFSLSLWLKGITTRLTLPLSCFSLLALVFSTSTTAYVGLFGFLLVQYAATGISLLFRSARPQPMLFLVVLPFVVVLVAILLSLNDGTAAYVGNLLDTTVFNKMSTYSGVERSDWNSQAIVNLLDTFGFGVGNGSLRASSFPIAVMASLGMIGTVTYALFLAGIWFNQNRPAAPAVMAIQAAGRSACLGWLIAATVSAGFIDLGLPFFAFAALACASLPAPRTHLAPARTSLRSFTSADANA